MKIESGKLVDYLSATHWLDLSEPVLTQLPLTPIWSQPGMFPLVLVPTSCASPLYPTSDYAPFVRTPILFHMSSFVLVSLCTMSLLFPTLDSYL